MNVKERVENMDESTDMATTGESAMASIDAKEPRSPEGLSQEEEEQLKERSEADSILMEHHGSPGQRPAMRNRARCVASALRTVSTEWNRQYFQEQARMDSRPE